MLLWYRHGGTAGPRPFTQPWRIVDDRTRIDEIIVRSLQGKATDGDEAVLGAWRRAEPENERHYQELVGLWNLTGLLESPTAAASGVPIQEVFDRVAGNARDQTADLTAVGDRGLSWRWWSAGLAAAAIMGVAGWQLPRSRDPAATPSVVTYVNHAGGLDTVRLSDGSVVGLAPTARLTVPPGGREVWLDGSAEFSVVHRGGERFMVHTPAGYAQVLGTRFLVRAGRGSTELLVLEGRVAVSAGAGESEVQAGETSVLLRGAQPRVTKVDQIRSSSDWLEAALIFQTTPLDEAALVIGRRFGIAVTVDPRLAHRTVSAWFTGHPTAAQVVDNVCRAVGAQCTVGDSAVAISSK